MIRRDIAAHLTKLLSMYPVVTVTGPRQSGKTTLVQNLLSDWSYVSLEDPDMRSFCQSDCRGFLESYPEHTIIDEAQRVPSLFSYLQTHIDAKNNNGMYVLTGSQNMNMMESISQSLAGRTSVLKLLPLSYEEQKTAGVLPASVNEQIFTGGYPRIFNSHIPPNQFYKDYIELYVERDVRQLKNIGNLDIFTRFVKLCAGRIGQLLNIQNLADDCGIGATTAKSWLSVLETSFIIYFLQPDYRNFTKRLVKSPKLYFCDTGLVCSLLEIKDFKQLETHYLRGNLFENLVVNRFRTRFFNNGEEPSFSFWRDKNGVEIDLVSQNPAKDNSVFAWEIKAGSTYSEDYFKNLKLWCSYSGFSSEHCSVIYTGQNALKTKNGTLIPWNEL
ncbi:MAG: ATP-binding protein [Treponemataceae bacterium]|nr:ATP-binding protein [Treponemataceae bacterium]